MRVNTSEDRLIAILDRKRVPVQYAEPKSVVAVKAYNNLVIPLRSKSEAQAITNTRANELDLVAPSRLPSNAELFAKHICLHGVPYLFRDTRWQCKQCNRGC